MSIFRPGDRVRLRLESTYYHQCRGNDGTVITYPDDYPDDYPDNWTRVQWDHIGRNKSGELISRSYPDDDLILLNPDYFTEQFNQEDIEKVKEEYGI